MFIYFIILRYIFVCTIFLINVETIFSHASKTFFVNVLNGTIICNMMQFSIHNVPNERKWVFNLNLHVYLDQ